MEGRCQRVQKTTGCSVGGGHGRKFEMMEIDQWLAGEGAVVEGWGVGREGFG